MQLIAGLILLIVAVGMTLIARPPAGQEGVRWLIRPWILGQAYVLAILVVAVVGVSLILGNWPA
jgi:hypothetical protein